LKQSTLVLLVSLFIVGCSSLDDSYRSETKNISYSCNPVPVTKVDDEVIFPFSYEAEFQIQKLKKECMVSRGFVAANLAGIQVGSEEDRVPPILYFIIFPMSIVIDTLFLAPLWYEYTFCNEQIISTELVSDQHHFPSGFVFNGTVEMVDFSTNNTYSDKARYPLVSLGEPETGIKIPFKNSGELLVELKGNIDDKLYSCEYRYSDTL